MVKLPGIALSIGKKNNAHDEAWCYVSTRIA